MSLKNIVFVLFISIGVTCYAQDDLTIANEMSAIRNFAVKHGDGFCSTLLVDKVQTVPRNIKSACESMYKKVSKAMRQCAAAADTPKCAGIVLDEDPDNVSGTLSCCGTLQKSGKMR